MFAHFGIGIAEILWFYRRHIFSLTGPELA
jgi:hypothetical protein